MMRNIWRLAGLLSIVLMVVGLWWWRQSTLPNSPVPNTAVPKQSTVSADADNFLPVERASPLTLASIVQNNFVIPAGTDMSRITTIVTTGDIIPARGTDIAIRQRGPNFPFEGPGIQELLSNADLTVVDLEAPILNNCPVHREGFTFCGQASFAAAMQANGIDVATLANNHIGNYGRGGIDETIQHLTSVGIRSVDSGVAHVETVGDLKLGFLAYNGIGVPFNRTAMVDAVKQLRPDVDILFVSLHWGKEYELLPKTDGVIAPDDPREIGHMLVDAGVDVVIGNHPHWVQGVELYKGKVISYALGNFIFDQSWSLETQQGMVAIYTFYGTKLIGLEFTPIRIFDQAQPRLATDKEASEIRNRFVKSTRQLNSVN